LLKFNYPFYEKHQNKVLCIIGQNPSNASERQADKTLRYLEQFVFQNLPQYPKILMLNLYSRVDTKKEEVEDLEREEIRQDFLNHLRNNADFLLVFGAKKKDCSGLIF